MAESLEHQWLSNEFIRILQTFSTLDLYGYTETDRKNQTFSCILQRDFDRPLVGQTLWKHTDGIDKDIRTLIAADNSDVWAYIVSDNMKNRRLFQEVIRDFQSTEYRKNLFKLKIFWIPEDFEAGYKESEEVTSRYLRAEIVDDILLNIVFGNLRGENIRFFLNTSGIPALNLGILDRIARYGFTGYADLARKLDISVSPVRERYLRVLGSGFIYETGYIFK